MNSQNTPRPPDLDELRQTMEDHSANEILSDKHERRRLLYEMLADHDDPMLKEMGQQLRDGQMTLMDLANTSVYRDHMFQSARDRLEEFQDTMRSLQDESGSEPKPDK